MVAFLMHLTTQANPHASHNRRSVLTRPTCFPGSLFSGKRLRDALVGKSEKRASVAKAYSAVLKLMHFLPLVSVAAS
jgi:hypothetical protein